MCSARVMRSAFSWDRRGGQLEIYALPQVARTDRILTSWRFSSYEAHLGWYLMIQASMPTALKLISSRGLLCIGMALPLSLWAQSSASVSGKVSDSTGASVPGAIVTVKSMETGAARVAVTDDGGNFRAVALSVGPQEIRVEKTGFKAAVRAGIDLAVGQDAVVQLRLEVGERAQTVTVTGEAPIVNTTTSSVSGLVSERQIKELPLNGRSFDNLITLNPGAISYTLRSPQTTTNNGNTFSVAGRRPSENLFLLNGVELGGSSQLANTPGGVSQNLLGIDAVREFNLLTDTYSAEYGKRAGGQISIVTKSGTNALHGSVFEFLRNSALDARNFFDQNFVPPFRRNQFGGSMGGPLKRDKLFLFGNYEGFRQSLAVTNVSVVPDLQARQGLLPNPQGVYTPVPNLNRNMLPYTALWPLPNGAELMVNGLPTGAALSYANPPQSIREDFGTVRGDYTISARDSLSAIYTVDNGESLQPAADPLFASQITLVMQVASLEETHVFSPRVLNTFRFGFSRAAYNLNSSAVVAFPPALDFVTGSGPGGINIGGTIASTGPSTITVEGPNPAAGAANRRNLFTATDGLQITNGIHQISAGVWFQRLQDNEGGAASMIGQSTFATLTTFLQGTVQTFQLSPSHVSLGWRSLLGAWYFQDAMKLRSNLTFQAGLRHEFTTGWNEVAKRAANFVADLQGVLETETRVGSSVFTTNNAKRLFGPRVSLAWDPFSNTRTAIRAGFGSYYSLMDALSFQLNGLPPYNGAATFSNVPLFSIVPVSPNVTLPRSCDVNVPPPCANFQPRGVQADAKTPTVQEWNFTVERQLDSRTSLHVAYVGSRGSHQLISIDPNSVPASVCAAGGCTAGGISTARATVAQGAQYIPVVASRPNPFLGAGFFWFASGNTSYQALQIDVNRRLAAGFQVRGNYTWSKNLDINSALTVAQANNQPQLVLDRNNLRRDWGPSALNVTHQSSISGQWELPLGNGKRWLNSATGLTQKLAGGWQLNGIATLLSGFPFTPTLGQNRSGDGNTRNPDRPDLNPSFTGPVVLGTPARWFDPNAFALPLAGTYGNLGRGVFRGPGLSELDVSAFKSTAISERASLQFRAEAFNILNRANFGTPNSVVFSGTSYSPSAGLITVTTTASRQIQFGLKLIF